MVGHNLDYSFCCISWSSTGKLQNPKDTPCQKAYILSGQCSSYGRLLFLINSPRQGWQCLRKRFLCRNQAHLHDKTLVQHHQRLSEGLNKGRVCFHLLPSIRTSQRGERERNEHKERTKLTYTQPRMCRKAEEDSGCVCALTVTTMNLGVMFDWGGLALGVDQREQGDLHPTCKHAPIGQHLH